MERKIDTVVFDMDGTILNTLDDLADAVNVALRAYQMPERTIEEVRRFVGNGIRLLMERAVPDGADNPQFEEVFAKFKEYYGVHCNDKTRAYDGILPLFRELKEAGYAMAIVSNKIDSAVKELSEIYFDGIITVAIGETEGVAKKPAPDMVQKALKELQVSAEEAIYVGDSDVDIATAKNSGLECVSVTWGFRDEEFLKEHGATNLIDEPVELLNYV